MLTKRSNPMIGRLSELLVSGNRVAGYLEVAPSPSPKSPLEYRIQSPKGRKSYDFGGVGLGIVAALEKSSSNTATNGIFSCNNINNRTDPIKIVHGREINREIVELDSLEDEEYTYVTSHGPDNKSSTKVYYDHGKSIVLDSGISGDFSVFSSIVKESSASTKLVDDEDYYPTSEFMNSCNLCKKKLQGKDIYIYRGENAFCSNECRSRHIMIDDRREHCKSEIKKSADVSSSSYTRSPIFSTGILAI